MHWIRLTSLGCVFVFAGCLGQEQPYQSEMARVEEHVLKLELKKAREVLDTLSENPDLPARYYKNAIDVHLLSFEFQKALTALGRLEEVTSQPNLKLRNQIGLGWLRHFAEYRDVAIKFEGIKALGELADTQAKDFIMQQFEFPSRTIRLAVSYSMALLGDKERALPYLQERAKYSSLKSRALASLFLVEMKDPLLMPDYRFMLKDPSNSVRALGLSVLATLKDVQSLDRMREIHDKTTDLRMKMMAAHALVRIGEERYRGTIEDAVSNPALRLDAQLILYDLGRTDLQDELFSRLDSLDLESRVAFLRTMIDEGHSKKVLKFLKPRVSSLSGSVFEKKMEIGLFGELCGLEGLKILRMQMANPFEEVQAVAVRAWLEASRRLLGDPQSA